MTVKQVPILPFIRTVCVIGAVRPFSNRTVCKARGLAVLNKLGEAGQKLAPHNREEAREGSRRPGRFSSTALAGPLFSSARLPCWAGP